MRSTVLQIVPTKQIMVVAVWTDLVVGQVVGVGLEPSLLPLAGLRLLLEVACGRG